MRALRIGLLGLALAGCSTTALPSTEESQQAITGCRDRRLYASEGRRLLEYDALGNARERFVFGVSQGEIQDGLGMSHWQAEGEFLAASMFLSSTTGAPSSHEIVLLDRDTVLFQTIYPNGQPQLHLGADGSLAVGGSRNFLRRADGSLIELGAYEPLGPLRADGSLPASFGPSYLATSPKGLLRPSAAAASTWPLDQFEDLVPTYGNVRATSRQFVYLRSSENEPSTPSPKARLVAVGIDRVARFDLPGSPQLVNIAGDRWVLLADGQSTTMTLVDLETSKVNLIANDSPVFQYELASATVDETGRVFTSVVREEQLQLVRTDDGGKTFVDVGSPMQRGEDLGFPPWLAPIAHHGSALMLNLSTGYGHRLNSVQFSADRTRTVMPGGGYYLAYNPDGAEADLTLDGQCAASWVLSEGEPFGETSKYSLVVIDHDGPRIIATTSAAYPAASFAN